MPVTNMIPIIRYRKIALLLLALLPVSFLFSLAIIAFIDNSKPSLKYMGPIAFLSVLIFSVLFFLAAKALKLYDFTSREKRMRSEETFDKDPALRDFTGNIWH